MNLDTTNIRTSLTRTQVMSPPQVMQLAMKNATRIAITLGRPFLTQGLRQAMEHTKKSMMDSMEKMEHMTNSVGMSETLDAFNVLNREAKNWEQQWLMHQEKHAEAQHLLFALPSTNAPSQTQWQDWTLLSGESLEMQLHIEQVGKRLRQRLQHSLDLVHGRWWHKCTQQSQWNESTLNQFPWDPMVLTQHWMTLWEKESALHAYWQQRLLFTWEKEFGKQGEALFGALNRFFLQQGWENIAQRQAQQTTKEAESPTLEKTEIQHGKTWEHAWERLQQWWQQKTGHLNTWKWLQRTPEAQQTVLAWAPKIQEIANNPEYLSQNLLQQLQQQHPQLTSLGTLAMAVDTIHTMFHRPQEQQWPIQLRSALMKLQIPLTKAALLDASIFETQDHAARKLINGIVTVAQQWSELGDRKSILLQHIQAMVQTLQAESHRPSVFVEQWAHFESFLRGIQTQSKMLETRTTQYEAAQEKRQRALHSAQLFVNNLIQQQPALPDFFVQWARSRWVAVAVMSYLRFGPTHIEHQRWAKLLKHSVQQWPTPISDGIRKAWFHQLKTFHITGKDALEAENVLKKLQATGKRGIVNNKETKNLQIIGTMEPIPQPTAIKIPKEIEVGRWLLFSNPQDNTQEIRGKIIWINRFKGTITLVGPWGMRLGEWAWEQLYPQWVTKLCTMIEQEPWFETGLMTAAQQKSEQPVNLDNNLNETKDIALRLLHVEHASPHKIKSKV